MGWVFIIVLAAVAFGALRRFGHLPRTGLELVGAALLIGIAGYAWQGSPAQPGNPVTSREAAGKVDAAAMIAQRRMRTGAGDEGAWLDMGDALNRAGATQEAVLAMRSGIRDHRNSPDLWVGLGNALVAHGDGLMSPAATFAFQHAANLSPQHPGPPFFYGLALAQQGKTEEAGDVWRGLLARTPKDAPWRADLEARLTAIGGMPTAVLKPTAPTKP
ncbi:cytochrome C biogenesis protein [Sphingomonas sp.]|uniref:tetratricopeptide repeat protein n=1 Tax=Sphingomonas sp. TaxID=28214 RepID=UPI0025F4990C|nr:cytochrome C biogenesis protein [Sphingomonas sp.]